MGRKCLLLCFIALVFINACSKGPAIEPYSTFQNVVYGTDTSQQNMDVYLPANRIAANTPVVILIHGGSWVTGSKYDFTGHGIDSFFNANGCAVVMMNYRLYSAYTNVAPLEMQDIGLVLDYLQQKAPTWKINSNRICLFGKSSGSQLALLYAFKYNQARRIKAVIDAYGPADFTDSSLLNDPNLNGNIAAMLNGPYATNMQAWHDYSPIFYLSGAVPVVIYQGTQDVIVPPVQSLMLEDSLLVRGVPNLFFNWVGDGHGWDQAKWLECRQPTWEFVKQYL